MVKVIAGLFLISLLPIITLAQNNSSIRGAIYTEGGAPAAGANIVIKGLHLFTRSDDDGHFAFGNIGAGAYTLNVSMVGYDSVVRNVTVKAGEAADITLTLHINPMQLQPVMVTAEKRESNLQQVPTAISALSSRQIEERKINEVGDLLLSVPNLMSMNIGAPTLSVIAIRGILTFSTQPAVGVYVDGVPMFDGYSSSIQFLNIERAEILRGPQSTLYGRNALGGIINIITQKPSNDVNGFAEAGAGSYGGQRYALGLSGPVVKNKLFAGFSGLYDTRNGYYTNLYDNKKYDKPETYNGNLYLKYMASQKLIFTFNAKGEYNNIRGTFPYVINADSAFAHPYRINQNGLNREKRSLYTLSFNAAYSTGTTQFSSTTAYTRLSDTYKDYDQDYSPYDALTFEMPLQTQKTFTEELRMVGNYGKRTKITAGIFGFIDQKPAQTVYIYGPDAVSMDPNAPYTSDIYADPHTYGIAGYAIVDYAVTDKFSVSAGLRYDYESRHMTFSMDMVKDPDPPQVILPERRLKGHDDAFSPKVVLRYNFTNDMMLYGSYTRGYHPGGFNQNTSDPGLLNYKPEYTDNFELGYKSEWISHKLRINADVFYTNWKDQQQTLMLPANATENVGKLVNQGVELELTALPLKGLELNYNLGIVHSDYKTLILPDPVDSLNKNYKGNKQVYTPEFTSALSLNYHYKFNDEWSLFIAPEWKYLGKQHMTYYNDLVQDAFSLVNASAGLQYRFIKVSIWAKNIGDARYLSFAYATSPGAFTPVLLGIPRTYGISLKAGF